MPLILGTSYIVNLPGHNPALAIRNRERVFNNAHGLEPGSQNIL
jgi:hypothetical protein